MRESGNLVETASETEFLPSALHVFRVVPANGYSADVLASDFDGIHVFLVPSDRASDEGLASRAGRASEDGLGRPSLVILSLGILSFQFSLFAGRGNSDNEGP